MYTYIYIYIAYIYVHVYVYIYIYRYIYIYISPHTDQHTNTWARAMPVRGQQRQLFRSSGMWCLRMWCLIIIASILSYN